MTNIDWTHSKVIEIKTAVSKTNSVIQSIESGKVKLFLTAPDDFWKPTKIQQLLVEEQQLMEENEKLAIENEKIVEKEATNQKLFDEDIKHWKRNLTLWLENLKYVMENRTLLLREASNFLKNKRCIKY